MIYDTNFIFKFEHRITLKTFCNSHLRFSVLFIYNDVYHLRLAETLHGTDGLVGEEAAGLLGGELGISRCRASSAQ